MWLLTGRLLLRMNSVGKITQMHENGSKQAYIRSKCGLTLDVKPHLVYNNKNCDLLYGYGKRSEGFPIYSNLGDARFF